jgi:hypothetical protein
VIIVFKTPPSCVGLTSTGACSTSVMACACSRVRCVDARAVSRAVTSVRCDVTM